ncbi:MAG: VOC family protein [Lachnospiraceae bacterium]|nr:VOC family protein [Lachnospiraceae bacterium]
MTNKDTNKETDKKMEPDEMRFHHVGIATADIPTMQEYLKSIARITHITDTVYDEQQQANLCMVTLSDGTDIELISGPQVEKLVKKRNFLYHTCYEVADIEAKIETLVEKGAILVSEPKEAILFNRKKVAFLMTAMGLIELVES